MSIHLIQGMDGAVECKITGFAVIQKQFIVSACVHIAQSIVIRTHLQFPVGRRRICCAAAADNVFESQFLKFILLNFNKLGLNLNHWIA